MRFGRWRLTQRPRNVVEDSIRFPTAGRNPAVRMVKKRSLKPIGVKAVAIPKEGRFSCKSISILPKGLSGVVKKMTRFRTVGPVNQAIDTERTAAAAGFPGVSKRGGDGAAAEMRRELECYYGRKCRDRFAEENRHEFCILESDTNVSVRAVYSGQPIDR